MPGQVQSLASGKVRSFPLVTLKYQIFISHLKKRVLVCVWGREGASMGRLVMKEEVMVRTRERDQPSRVTSAVHVLNVAVKALWGD